MEIAWNSIYQNFYNAKTCGSTEVNNAFVIVAFMSKQSIEVFLNLTINKIYVISIRNLKLK